MRAGRMDRIVTLYEMVTTENDFGEQIETEIELVKVGTEIATGTLVLGTLYQITKTEADHFGAGLVIYDTFTAAGTETCDTDNKVKPVTLPGTVWAEKQWLRGSEKYQSMQVVGEIQCIYKIRYRDDLSVLNIFIDNEDKKEYNISYIKQLGRKEGLEITASARSEG